MISDFYSTQQIKPFHCVHDEREVPWGFSELFVSLNLTQGQLPWKVKFLVCHKETHPYQQILTVKPGCCCEVSNSLKGKTYPEIHRPWRQSCIFCLFHDNKNLTAIIFQNEGLKCEGFVFENDNASGRGAVTMIYTLHLFPTLCHVSDTAVLFHCHFCQPCTKRPITSSFRVSKIVWKQPRRSACCSLRGQLTLIWRTPPSRLFKSCPVQHWRRLRETRACSFNPFLDPIIRFHFHGRSCWVCYGITLAKKKGHFLRRVQEMKQPSQGALGTPCGLCFPWTSCCF